MISISEFYVHVVHFLQTETLRFLCLDTICSFSCFGDAVVLIISLEDKAGLLDFQKAKCTDDTEDGLSLRVLSFSNIAFCSFKRLYLSLAASFPFGCIESQYFCFAEWAHLLGMLKFFP
ncbi:hypothetical protein EDC96DRAFT_544586 [Choanephora cucurbitarum]|nr:hypothetical protein EDC96DRAFT_544586 [Choanephora cucurbitarum]